MKLKMRMAQLLLPSKDDEFPAELCEKHAQVLSKTPF
jgi:hypothetical protein